MATKSDTTKRTREVLAALAGEVSGTRNAARAYLDARLSLGRDPAKVAEIELRAYPGCGGWHALNSHYSRLIAVGVLVVICRRRGARKVALAHDIDGAALRSLMGDYERTSRRTGGGESRACPRCGHLFERKPVVGVCAVCEAVETNPALGVRLDYYADRAARDLPLFGPGRDEVGYQRPAWNNLDY